jgi:hypothetical protein
MITRQMNTANMSSFLAQVHARHRRDFMVMVVDGASSHVAKDLVVPENSAGWEKLDRGKVKELL